MAPAALSSQGPILVAGAGIGGLTAARALELAGFEVRLFERAAALREVGAGITVQANAMRALRHLGLEEVLLAHGQRVDSASIWAASGRVLGTTSLEEVHRRLGAVSVILHRARLQQLLASALERTEIRLGKEAVGFVTDDGCVTVRFADGSSETGAALLGCDGRDSVIRRQLLDDGPLRYAGYTTWRGIALGEPPLSPGTATEIWGGGRRFGIVPLGGEELYWYACRNAPPGGRDGEEPGAELRELFADYPSPVAQVLAATPPDRLLRTDIFDRPPTRTWTRGRVALLGDAVHPMEPNLGQGGCQAMEDAAVLADALAGSETFEEGFAQYQGRRVERTAWFVETSARFGRLTQRLPAWTAPLRDLVLRLTPPSALVRSMERAQAFELREARA